MPLLPRVLNNSYPIKMVCECETLSYKGTPIHTMPVYPQVMVCDKFAYIKFDIDDEAVWLCAECLAHRMAFIQNPTQYEITEVIN